MRPIDTLATDSLPFRRIASRGLCAHSAGVVTGAIAWLLGACSVDGGWDANTHPPVVSATRQGNVHAPIVDNPAPDWSRPTLRIGVQVARAGGRHDAEHTRELWSVGDAALRANGHLIAVFHGGREVREFDASGKSLRELGGIGQGPGEFGRITRLRILASDSLVMLDRDQGRLLSYSPDGESVRTTQLPRFIRGFVCCLADGSVLFHHGVDQTSPDSTSRPRNEWYIAGTTRGRAEPAHILTAEGHDPAVRVGPLPMTGPGVQMRNISPPGPFARRAIVTIADDEIIYGIGDSFEYRVFSQSGVLQRVVRATILPRPVSDDDDRAARQRFADEATGVCIALRCDRTEVAGVRDAFERAAKGLTLPKTWPAYSAIIGDDDGSVWVGEYTVDADRPQAWAKFDRDGKLHGILHTPAGFSVIRFTRGHVLLGQVEPVDGFAFVFAHRIEPIGEGHPR